ncbi:mechanosensitive ion channel family protein [Glaciecola sp. 2405UD65-10]|uniref:mechanosensitive ion channel family protein n=1 Tax=Glaciecola sp. 2405UD65-10 TaxID=3397244 RepID=UPI003B5C0CAC
MNSSAITSALADAQTQLALALSESHTYIQLAVVAAIYVFSFLISKVVRSNIAITNIKPDEHAHPLKRLLYKASLLIGPLLAVFLIKIFDELATSLAMPHWVINLTLAIAVLLLVNSIINVFVNEPVAARLFKWIGLPIVFLQVVGLLDDVIAILSDISLNIGNVSVSAYGIIRVLIFGSLLFWLGRASNSFGKAVIRKQASLDVPTKEVFSKLFEVTLFCIIVLLLLNVMGINLTTLAVFGGALGVGIGLGLQSIASNFISGIIILLDRSLTIGDYVELDNGQTGFVREFKMRYAVLETYDGKDILVPNEMFISNLLVNWSHKDPKQRYRVDFAVPYATNIREMVEYVKDAVAEHPQVLSGEQYPVEERPDCEIDSFGDSGVNMFVEFWMIGVDDGKNRVGGDLLLIIFETLKENGVDMPFPQREVRILKDENK